MDSTIKFTFGLVGCGVIIFPRESASFKCETLPYLVFYFPMFAFFLVYFSSSQIQISPLLSRFDFSSSHLRLKFQNQNSPFLFVPMPASSIATVFLQQNLALLPPSTSVFRPRGIRSSLALSGSRPRPLWSPKVGYLRYLSLSPVSGGFAGLPPSPPTSGPRALISATQASSSRPSTIHLQPPPGRGDSSPYGVSSPGLTTPCPPQPSLHGPSRPHAPTRWPDGRKCTEPLGWPRLRCG